MHDNNHFIRGKKTEVEQLQANGLEKNHQIVREVDPKTGRSGATIPDAFKNEGKSTTEIKNVVGQTLTRQLRLQEQFSQNNGFTPELIINDHAQISKPLLHSAFVIKTYSFENLSGGALSKENDRSKDLTLNHLTNSNDRGTHS